MPTRIETPRLILRSPELADTPGLHAVLGDPEAMRFIPSGVKKTLEETEAQVRRRIELEETLGMTAWTVVEKETGEIIGGAGLFPVERKGPEIEVAYHLVRSRWGRGYATEAAAASMRHGFESLGLARIIAICNPANTASSAVMRRCGMTYLGWSVYYERDVVMYEKRRSPGGGA